MQNSYRFIASKILQRLRPNSKTSSCRVIAFYSLSSNRGLPDPDKCIEHEEDQEDPIDGKVAIITGGAQGIGFDLAQTLLKNGVKGVTLADNDCECGEKSCLCLCEEYGDGCAMFCNCDVMKSENMDSVFRKTMKHFKRVDLVINNAGILNDKKWESEITVNIGGCVIGSLLGLQYMSKSCHARGGVVLNVANTAGIDPLRGCPIYTMTQSAIIGFTRALGSGCQYLRTGVKVIGLCAGPTNTRMMKQLKSKAINEHFAKELLDEMKESQLQPMNFVSNGIMKVLSTGESGSIWIAHNNEEAFQVCFPKCVDDMKVQDKREEVRNSKTKKVDRIKAIVIDKEQTSKIIKKMDKRVQTVAKSSNDISKIPEDCDIDKEIIPTPISTINSDECEIKSASDQTSKINKKDANVSSKAKDEQESVNVISKSKYNLDAETDKLPNRRDPDDFETINLNETKPPMQKLVPKNLSLSTDHERTQDAKSSVLKKIAGAKLPLLTVGTMSPAPAESSSGSLGTIHAVPKESVLLNTTSVRLVSSEAKSSSQLKSKQVNIDPCANSNEKQKTMDCTPKTECTKIDKQDACKTIELCEELKNILSEVCVQSEMSAKKACRAKQLEAVHKLQLSFPFPIPEHPKSKPPTHISKKSDECEKERSTAPKVLDDCKDSVEDPSQNTKEDSNQFLCEEIKVNQNKIEDMCSKMKQKKLKEDPCKDKNKPKLYESIQSEVCKQMKKDDPCKQTKPSKQFKDMCSTKKEPAKKQNRLKDTKSQKQKMKKSNPCKDKKSDRQFKDICCKKESKKNDPCKNSTSSNQIKDICGKDKSQKVDPCKEINFTQNVIINKDLSKDQSDKKGDSIERKKPEAGSVFDPKDGRCKRKERKIDHSPVTISYDGKPIPPFLPEHLNRNNASKWQKHKKGIGHKQPSETPEKGSTRKPSLQEPTPCVSENSLPECDITKSDGKSKLSKEKSIDANLKSSTRHNYLPHLNAPTNSQRQQRLTTQAGPHFAAKIPCDKCSKGYIVYDDTKIMNITRQDYVDEDNKKWKYITYECAEEDHESEDIPDRNCHDSSNKGLRDPCFNETNNERKQKECNCHINNPGHDLCAGQASFDICPTNNQKLIGTYKVNTARPSEICPPKLGYKKKRRKQRGHTLPDAEEYENMCMASRVAWKRCPGFAIELPKRPVEMSPGMCNAWAACNPPCLSGESPIQETSEGYYAKEGSCFNEDPCPQPQQCQDIEEDSEGMKKAWALCNKNCGQANTLAAALRQNKSEENVMLDCYDEKMPGITTCHEEVNERMKNTWKKLAQACAPQQINPCSTKVVMPACTETVENEECPEEKIHVNVKICKYEVSEGMKNAWERAIVPDDCEEIPHQKMDCSSQIPPECLKQKPIDCQEPQIKNICETKSKISSSNYKCDKSEEVDGIEKSWSKCHNDCQESEAISANSCQNQISQDRDCASQIPPKYLEQEPIKCQEPQIKNICGNKAKIPPSNYECDKSEEVDGIEKACAQCHKDCDEAAAISANSYQNQISQERDCASQIPPECSEQEPIKYQEPQIKNICGTKAKIPPSNYECHKSEEVDSIEKSWSQCHNDCQESEAISANSYQNQASQERYCASQIPPECLEQEPIKYQEPQIKNICGTKAKISPSNYECDKSEEVDGIEKACAQCHKDCDEAAAKAADSYTNQSFKECPPNIPPICLKKVVTFMQEICNPKSKTPFPKQEKLKFNEMTFADKYKCYKNNDVDGIKNAWAHCHRDYEIAKPSHSVRTLQSVPYIQEEVSPLNRPDDAESEGIRNASEKCDKHRIIESSIEGMCSPNNKSTSKSIDKVVNPRIKGKQCPDSREQILASVRELNRCIENITKLCTKK